jgi:hypothetical protein
MRKSLFSLAALPLALGACTTSPYGGYGYNDPVTSAIGVLGTVLGGQRAYSPYGGGYSGGYGYGGGNFSQAAVNACGNYASRYGQVAITNVRQTSNDKVHVYGYAGNRDFDCSFRSDGRITDFDR